MAGCKTEKKTQSAPPPPKVEVIAVRRADVPVMREWVGTLDGSDNASIQAQVSGYLIKQNYADGTAVKKGELLFELDERTFKAKAEQAKADIALNEAKVKKSQMDVDRYTPLAKDDAISQQELDDAIQELAGAKAALQSAVAAYDDAMVQWGYTKITSPISGIAGIKSVNIGELISPGRGDLTVVSTIDPIKADFTISENEYLEFRKTMKNGHPDAEYAERSSKLDGAKFELVLFDGSVYELPGKFYASDRQFDQRTGSIQLQVLFPNPHLLLRPGQFARVRSAVRIEKNAMLVPQRAVTEVQGVYFVAAVGADKKVAVKRVTVGDRIGSDWIIKSGLEPNDHVVTEGTQKARDGATVEPVLITPAADKNKQVAAAK